MAMIWNDFDFMFISIRNSAFSVLTWSFERPSAPIHTFHLECTRCVDIKSTNGPFDIRQSEASGPFSIVRRCVDRVQQRVCEYGCRVRWRGEEWNPNYVGGTGCRFWLCCPVGNGFRKWWIMVRRRRPSHENHLRRRTGARECWRPVLRLRWSQIQCTFDSPILLLFDSLLDFCHLYSLYSKEFGRTKRIRAIIHLPFGWRIFRMWLARRTTPISRSGAKITSPPTVFARWPNGVRCGHWNSSYVQKDHDCVH